MSKRTSAQARCTVHHSPHLKPEDVLTFIELDGFRDELKDLKLEDTDLQALQLLLMVHPVGSPVIPGTGGLRKIRFAPARWGTGKRGAARVCYVYFPDWNVILLITIYSKSEQDTLPPRTKAAYAKAITRIKDQLAIRFD